MIDVRIVIGKKAVEFYTFCYNPISSGNKKIFYGFLNFLVILIKMLRWLYKEVAKVVEVSSVNCSRHCNDLKTVYQVLQLEKLLVVFVTSG